MEVTVSKFREGDGTGKAIMRWVAANTSGVYVAMDAPARAKASEISSSINSHARSKTFTHAANAKRSPMPQSKLPAYIIHPTSRGAYGIAVKHNLMHW